MPDYDMPELLDKWAEVVRIPSGDFINTDLRAAATHVRELRAELTRLTERCEAYKGQIEAGSAEIARLTSELEKAKGREAALVEATASCEGEQYKFEEWARQAGYDMHEHPLHYMFMHTRTDAARMGWKAALEYLRQSAALSALGGTGR